MSFIVNFLKKGIVFMQMVRTGNPGDVSIGIDDASSPLLQSDANRRISCISKKCLKQCACCFAGAVVGFGFGCGFVRGCQSDTKLITAGLCMECCKNPETA
jgi:hypothetical protein